MHYKAIIQADGPYWTVEFPDAPGCLTFGESHDDAVKQAHEALYGWLESHFVDGAVPPRPQERSEGVAIMVPLTLAAALEIRWARSEQGISQAELAQRVGVSQQQVAKIERPKSNASLATLERVAKALGCRVSVSLQQGT